MEALACSLPLSHVIWSCGWQEFVTKARAAMFFQTPSMLFFFFFSTWVLLCMLGVELREAEVVFLSISISPEVKQGWQMCPRFPLLLQSKKHSLRYVRIRSCICSAISSAHTNRVEVQTVVKRTQGFLSHDAVIRIKHLNSRSSRSVLAAGLGLVGPLCCLANLCVWLVKL